MIDKKCYIRLLLYPFMKKIIATIVISVASAHIYAQSIDWWLTKGDQSVLLRKQSPITFRTAPSTEPFIIVDETKTYQSIDGFGYTLTGSSAQLISKMDAAPRAALLKELFGNADNSIGISYLRLSIGASDLNPYVFSYDDIPSGGTDESLSHFNLAFDRSTLVPLLQQILKINPQLKIMAAPWSAPAWMKDNNSTIGGTLQTRFYGVYANYFVKYLQAMKAAGITIDAVTPQNEPQVLHNNPSMGFSAEQELIFVKSFLGPALKQAGLKTKIVIWDHNCDNVQYPLSILKDETAAGFIDGSAFHLYAGDINALSQVHNAFPKKNIYFTEQYTADKGDFGGDIKWHLKNVLTGAMRNWSRTVIEWNLANDPTYGPHTPNGGCSTCKGALTIDGSSVKRNVSYYIIAHASKFVPAGSTRIWSNIDKELYTVAFLTSSGKKVLIVENDGNTTRSFDIKYKGQLANCILNAGNVATYVWQ